MSGYFVAIYFFLISPTYFYESSLGNTHDDEFEINIFFFFEILISKFDEDYKSPKNAI